MSSSSIALRVYVGSHEGGLNPTPIVSVGDAPRKFAPFTPVLVKEDRSWSITHGLNHTVYTLHTKEYPTSDGQPGQLLVCLLLPPTHLLASKASPLELLNAVLTLIGDMVPTSPVDNSEFSALLEKYSLTERVTSLPMMIGAKVVAFRPKDQNQLKALMLYSRYPALEKVARLELGMNCETTINLPLPGSKPPKPQEASTPPSPDTTNKTSDFNVEEHKYDTGKTEASGNEKSSGYNAPHTPDAYDTYESSETYETSESPKKKINFIKIALWIGVVVAILELLLIFWPKSKASIDDNPVAEQTNPDPTPAPETSEEAAIVADAPAKEKVAEEKHKEDTPAMDKTTAIGVLLSGQGDTSAARKALSSQERNDIETIKSLYDNSKGASQIISQLTSGNLSIASAKSKLQDLTSPKEKDVEKAYKPQDPELYAAEKKDPSSSGRKMTRSEAIGVLLSGNGDIAAANNSLSPNERNDLKYIQYQYSSASGAEKKRIKSIIDGIRSGGSISAARQQIQNILNGESEKK